MLHHEKCLARMPMNVRFFACRRDLSHEPSDAQLPAPVASEAEPLIGASSGG
jgi:hypothetical protein